MSWSQSYTESLKPDVLGQSRIMVIRAWGIGGGRQVNQQMQKYSSIEEGESPEQATM